ncbi:hypothetical protein [Pandoraea sp.]|uniref:hypothetical protein n=1 Tax=Pandoraea sp. TaxID=1883445 RepID=UPI0011FEA55F|nr:hypothetical protein [Pandoraea sp.]TAL54756.1 MAG: hypothetical protein EPN80_09705 [Pandoraea sp.]TAM18476.1 MAG: hypothetical protein EPN65_06935 [Pandoraea sp.]
MKIFNLRTVRWLALPTTAVITALVAVPSRADHAECKLVLNQPSIEYGQLTRGQLLDYASASGEASLDPRFITLTATCGKPASMSLFLRSAAADTERFRFAEHGSYTVRLSEARLDGQPVHLSEVSAGGPGPLIVSRSETTLQLKPGFGAALTALDGQPAVGSHLTARVEVQTRIPVEATRVSGMQRWQGRGTFELITR